MGRLASLYPLRGLPRQKQLWAWIAFDVANQSFTLLINTLLFSIFFSKVVVKDPTTDDRYWSLASGGSMLLAAILSPVAGAIADAKAWKKELLLGSGVMCAVLTCLLGLIPESAPNTKSALVLALALYIPANLAFSLGENFLASFLPSLAGARTVGRVSGFSWACAYSAALLLLIATAVLMVGMGWKDAAQWRPFFVGAGVWFLVFLIPTALVLDEPPLPDAPRGHFVTLGLRRLVESFRNTARYRDLAWLLVASLFYGTGMSVVIFFASKLAEEYGFKQEQLVLFVAVITVSGIVGTLLPTFAQDRVGHRKMTAFLVSVWLATTLAFALYAYRRAHAPDPSGYPNWPLWLVGNLLGFGLGSLGAANRAFVGFLAPQGREAEVFGLWGLVFKLAAVGTFPFAWAKDTLGTPSALLVLAGFLAVGLGLTFLVDEKRGRAQASAE